MANPITSRITPILGTYYQATESDRINGRQWYQQAHDAAADLSRTYPTGIITTAGIISALSPNNKWSRNLLDADQLLDTFHSRGPWEASRVRVCTYDANKAKALAILKLTSPTLEDVLTVLNGRKVSAFYRCILGDQQAVCVDGHAYSIWLGERVTIPKTPTISPALFEQIAADYRTATSIVNNRTPSSIVNNRTPTLHGPDLTPAQLQAITWVAHRRLNR